ncbi:alkene reductase [Glycomyces algeriensis]|uniref:Alkene reductase n=1 Tax=Glycomyces algeriensis TaxID=256037 RepID=A0A9W6G5R0_9ACTN|nr:alkene reductase [Glycomyces algeriensis]MDA1368952.1 alkene reductase [Glycomyces algeriensis]MDR7353305.1 N-ethylmaleimide reductase [Glycomyces algeriensis]GLI41001.1 alkene reductase [Glycomyces algeriensis]
MTNETAPSQTGPSPTAAHRLFSPARLGALDLPNRVVMPPMSRNRAAAGGVPTPLMAEYYAQRATAGLIVAEASSPSQVGYTYPDIPGIFTDSQVDGWRQVTDAVHAAGGRIFLQVEHGGRIGHPDTSGLIPLAPSAIPLPGYIHTPNGHGEPPVPREMSKADLQDTLADFTAAARNAIRAGADGVEVHAANGYLLNQFLATSTNHRTDEYGGSVAGRIKFVVEVVEAVAAAIGPERTGLRLSPGNPHNGIDVDDADELFPALLDALAPLGLAYLHLAYASPTPLFAAIRERWQGILIANPSNPEASEADPIPADGGLAAAERILDAGADLVALGRPFIANPDLVERLRTGAPVTPLRTDLPLYGGGAAGYTDYPVISASDTRSVSA